MLTSCMLHNRSRSLQHDAEPFHLSSPQPEHDLNANNHNKVGNNDGGDKTKKKSERQREGTGERRGEAREVGH